MSTPQSSPSPSVRPSCRERIERRLSEGLAPVDVLRVIDDSHRHATHGERVTAMAAHGHAPLDGIGETHFRVEVVSPVFVGKTRLERHRLVHDLLDAELRERVHALTIKARTPEEAAVSGTDR